MGGTIVIRKVSKEEERLAWTEFMARFSLSVQFHPFPTYEEFTFLIGMHPTLTITGVSTFTCLHFYSFLTSILTPGICFLVS